MIKYFCDRCRKEMGEPFRAELSFGPTWERTDRAGEAQAELCSECARSLIDYVRNFFKSAQFGGMSPR